MRMIALLWLAFACLFAASGDALAQETWARTYGGVSGDDFAYCAQQTADGGYIAAGYGKSYGKAAWVLKLQTDGGVAWQKKYSGTGEVYTIQQTADGGYVLVDTRFTVLKLDHEGSIVWQRSYDDAAELGESIRQTTDGGYVVARVQDNNLLVSRLGAGGEMIWQKSYGEQAYAGSPCIQPDAGGGFLLAGTRFRYSDQGAATGYLDIWAARLDENGEIVWQKVYTGERSSYVNSIQPTADGGYIATGYSYAGGALVLKLLANGDLAWKREYITGGGGESIRQTADGGYILVTSNLVALKLDANGASSWQKMYVGPDGSSAESIQQTADGGYAIAGCNGSFAFVQYDAWVLKTDADGDIPGADFIREVSAKSGEPQIEPQNTSFIAAATEPVGRQPGVVAWDVGWRTVPGLLAQLASGDLNGDGRDDLAGLDADGHVYYTLDLHDWQWLPGTLSQLTTGDFNGDGRADLAGVSPGGAVFYTSDLANWQWLPGMLARLAAGNLNGDGIDDLVGLTAAGQIFYTLDLYNWHWVAGTLNQLSVGDLNADDVDELAGVTSAGQVFYTEDLQFWQWLPGVLSQTAIGRLDRTTCIDHLCSTILVDQLLGLTAAGQIYWNKSYIDTPDWTYVPGTLAQLATGDLDGDGQADLAGLDAVGRIYYSIGF